jgi:hypothetical protein
MVTRQAADTNALPKTFYLWDQTLYTETSAAS